MSKKFIIAIFLALSSITRIHGMTSSDYLATLPPDLQRVISAFIATGPTLADAVKDVKNFTQTNKRFTSLLKDSRFIESLINHLATQYKQENVDTSKIAAAIALGANTQAGNWLRSMLSNPSMKNAAQAYLLKAAQAGDLKAATFLANAGVDLNTKDAEGSTPLMHAASQGRTSVVDFLLAHGAQPNLTNNVGNAALVVAALAGHKSVVENLIKAGADVNIKAKNGSPILLLLAAKPTLIDIFKVIVNSKTADINYANPESNNTTALIIASGLNNEEAVKELLDKGVTINAKTTRGDTALSFARRNRYANIVKLLESYDAKE
jgi:ankyrin repeat protein